MALLLKIGDVCVGNGCKSIFFSENTGQYDAILNTTGWNNTGADPNILISSVTATHLIISLNGAVIVNILNPVGLPTGDTSLQYEVTAAVMGGTTIPDGLYQIEYTVTSGGVTYTTGKIYKLFSCNAECCVSRMFAKIATLKDCSCDSTVITNALYAGALLEGLLANKNCGNIGNMETLISKLTQICNLTSTDCGCSS